MNWLDYTVLIGSILAIAMYGIWQTRNRTKLHDYLKGTGHNHWLAIGLSVMATQASAITFLSTPGQGYMNGLSFVQVYFGVPIALLIISIFFLPIYQKLDVYTAYEYLEKRFDNKTRTLGAALFLLQRGLGAGLTIYAPAIVMTSVFGWPLNLTIISCGLLVIVYTAIGGSDAVTLTQKYQMAVIFAGMLTATALLISKLPAGFDLGDTFKLAGGFHRIDAVNFSTSLNQRYTFWSGLLGGTFMMLSYFGTDQSQVQRYISGSDLRESRLGLLFNAVCKIPMQFSILSIGVLMFIFYQFQPPPIFFDSRSREYLESHRTDTALTSLESDFNKVRGQTSSHLQQWLKYKHSGNVASANNEFLAAALSEQRGEAIKTAAGKELAQKNPDAKANDADYVFMTFILQELPHGVIGLLIAAFFAAALSSKAAELNALATSSTIDIYRRIINRTADDAACLTATKWFTVFWGVVAISFALFAHFSENLIQAVNIIGSIFYGVMLGLFLVAFFIKRIGGTAVFWGSLVAQGLVFVLFFTLSISYLWYPLIGCAASIGFSLILQQIMGNKTTINEYAS